MGTDYLTNSSFKILRVAFPLFPFYIANVNIDVRDCSPRSMPGSALWGVLHVFKDIFVHNIQVEKCTL